MRTALVGLLVGVCVGPAFAQEVQPRPMQPPGAPVTAAPATQLAPSEIRELLEAARETAKATREGVDYGRVVPDLLIQVLAKLDKIENKLDKIEEKLVSGRRKSPR